MNQNSLTQIVNAPKDFSIHSLLNFSQDYVRVLIPGLTEPAYLERVVIAAKFNHTVPFGWPALQIRRRDENGSYISVYITREEPQPTGYLNVYEYDLSDNEFEFYPGEQIRISWLPSNTASNPARYSLAYHRGIVMAVGLIDHTTSTTSEINSVSSSSNTVTSVEHATTMFTTKMNTTGRDQLEQPGKATATVAIIGGVLCTLAVIILLVVLAIAVFVVCRSRNHTKEFSPTANDLYTSVLPRSSGPTLQNPTYSLVDSELQ